MNNTEATSRTALIRKAVTFQLKLMADGLRDLVLMPVALIATAVGLLRGGEEPEREFQQVLALGRQSELWINLFGNHELEAGNNTMASMDDLFTQLEAVLKKQYKTDGTSQSAQSEIEEALHTVRESVPDE